MSRTKSDGMSDLLRISLVFVVFMAIPVGWYFAIGAMTESWSYDTGITAAFATVVTWVAVGLASRF